MREYMPVTLDNIFEFLSSAEYGILVFNLMLSALLCWFVAYFFAHAWNRIRQWGRS